MLSQTPVYNLNAVLRETGLKADVLRAWERRYELPRPQRSPGGHRLYSAYDIETIKWLRARQSEGMSISSAVGLWNETLAAGRDPIGGQDSAAVVSSLADAQIDTLRAGWLAACMAFDERRAEDVLAQALALYPVETVCEGIMQQGLNEIGRLWYSGKATVQQEHFTSAHAARRIDALISAAPAPTRQQSVLIGCPPGEWHTFSLLLLHLILRRRGFKVINLGANVPLEMLSATVESIRPELVVLAAQQLVTAGSLSAAASALRAGGHAVAYGGLIFNRVPELRERIPAYFLGESIAASLATIERLAGVPAAYPREIDLDAQAQRLAAAFRRQRARIELAQAFELDQAGVQIERTAEIQADLGNGMAAALDLGEVSFLTADLEWIRWLLAGRQLNTRPLIDFLTAYRRAVESQMGADGEAITRCLDAFMLNPDNMRQ